jgi:tRNA1(Val) A37 N6-methylase TrmN6
MGTLMMTLQKCLMEQSDITELLKQLDFDAQGEELVVLNPPMLRVTEENNEEPPMPREEDF